MELAYIRDNIGKGKIVTDIYSGDMKCSCSKNISFTELSLGDFGSSLAFSC